MLDQMRPTAQGRRRGASAFEFTLLVASIAVVVGLVAFAFGSYLHSALRTGCSTTASGGSVTSACSTQPTAP
jgi:Flp pilus assembly pilin Flp